jgi:hypothetical protein
VLYDVAALSPRDAWAVGSQARGRKPLIEHWNGRSWTVVRGAATAGVLNAVTAVSRDDVWTVGDVHVGPAVWRPLAEHWDGHRWSRVAMPAADGVRAAVVAFSSTSVWASGLAEGASVRWDGTAWRPLGFDLGSALTGTSDDDVWTAFGAIAPNESQTALHWDGSGWTQFDLPVPNGGSDPNRFFTDAIAAAAFSRTDAWMGGYAVGYPSFFASFIDHWDGTQWTMTYRRKGAIVNDIAALSPTDAWAVGARPLNGGWGRRARAALILQWDGRRWREVHAPAAGFYAVAATATDVWAVGGMPTDALRDYNVDDIRGRSAVVAHLGCVRRP